MGLFDFLSDPAGWWDDRTTERETDAQVRRLRRKQATLAEQIAVTDAERSLAEAASRLAETRLRARTATIAAARDAFEAEVDLQFRRHVYSLPATGAVTTIREELEREHTLLEWELVRQQRLERGKGNGSVASGGLLPALAEPRATPPRALPPPATDGPPLTVHYADRDIEALALKAVTRFGMLPAPQATAAWTRWEAEARSRLPANVAEEVIGRAAELRGVTGR